VYERTEVRDVVVGDISFTLTYPAYTHLVSRVENNTGGDLRALIGTQVEVRTRALEEAVSAQLIFTTDQDHPIPLKIDGLMLSGQFTVTGPATFHFELVDSNGVRFLERTERTVEPIADVKPDVSVLQPTTDVEVRTLEPIRLYFTASDDFGVSRVDLVTSRFESGEPAVHRRVASPDGERSFVGDAEVDLARLEVEAGETVEAWLEVYDNNTVSESLQMSRSRKIRIKRHSPGEQHDENVAAQRQLADQMLGILADRLESPIEKQSTRHYERSVEVQRRILDSNKGLLGALKDVLTRLQNDPLASQDVIAIIQDIQERYDAHDRVESGQIQAALNQVRLAERTSRLDNLNRSNETAIADLERDITRLDELISRQHQKRLLDRAKTIALAQKELMELLDKLGKTDDPAARRKLQLQLNQLLRKVEKLMAQVQQHARPAPYENINLDALEPGDDVREMQTLKSTIQKMQEAVRNGQIDEAKRLAEDLGRRIQMLNSEFESGLQEMSDKRGDQRQAQLKKMSQGVSKAIARQEAVERQTRNVDELGKAALNKLIKEREAPKIAKQLEAIRELGRRVDRVDRNMLHKDDVEALEAIHDGVADLRETLAQEDLGQAVPLSKSVKESLRRLEREVEQGVTRLAEREGASYRVTKRREQRRRIAQARRKAVQIAKELERIMPGPDDLYDRGQRKRLSRLAERQRRVGERVQRLQSKLPALEAEAPGITQRLSQMLSEAEKEMQEASKRLAENQPGRALGHEERARDRLNRAKEAASEELKRRGSPSDRPGIGNTQQEVTIPDADKYAVPAEYRDALLRSLREQAPPSYKQLIRRYYEALVQ
jgi:hypothetical protein